MCVKEAVPDPFKQEGSKPSRRARGSKTEGLRVMTRASGAWVAAAAAVAIVLGWEQASLQMPLAYTPSARDGAVSAIDQKIAVALRERVTSGQESARSAAAAQSRTAVAAATSLQRTSKERAVTVTVTPLNLFDGGETLDFRVVLETHSVNLDYDLTRIAELRDGGGNVHRPASWDGPKGGHHVTGVLRFKDRQRIVAAGTNDLELQISGVAGVASRLFRWNLKEAR
jgi:hypothetical protein